MVLDWRECRDADLLVNSVLQATDVHYYTHSLVDMTYLATLAFVSWRAGEGDRHLDIAEFTSFDLSQTAGSPRNRYCANVARRFRVSNICRSNV